MPSAFSISNFGVFPVFMIKPFVEISSVPYFSVLSQNASSLISLRLYSVPSSQILSLSFLKSSGSVIILEFLMLYCTFLRVFGSSPSMKSLDYCSKQPESGNPFTVFVQRYVFLEKETTHSIDEFWIFLAVLLHNKASNSRYFTGFK